MRVSSNKKEGQNGAGLRVCVIVSRFNSAITGDLLSGALEGLKETHVRERDIEVIEVPGAFEAPQAAARIAKLRRPDAIIALGAVIRGETPHFEYISSETTGGLMRVALDSGIPVLSGVLTVNTLEQAVSRSTGKENKGREAALGAVEMALLFKSLTKKQGVHGNKAQGKRKRASNDVSV
ncbi:MAG TPA: 6,7-dimethyl-8-ribityllumazine synthase [Nitrospiria bacterium]|nr:6,7-dimethyl-8-ribityllumazine synthase [Nitrospiria bacterium]